jgi:hypothetical protein
MSVVISVNKKRCNIMGRSYTFSLSVLSAAAHSFGISTTISLISNSFLVYSVVLAFYQNGK